jgi:hypothetical protein
MPAKRTDLGLVRRLGRHQRIARLETAQQDRDLARGTTDHAANLGVALALGLGPPRVVPAQKRPRGRDLDLLAARLVFELALPAASIWR